MLDQPEAYEALQWMADLRGKHHVAPTPSDAMDIGPQKLFTNGQIGMIISGSWATPLIFEKEVTNFDYDVAPIPKGKRRAHSWGAAFGVLNRSSTRRKPGSWRVRDLADLPRLLCKNPAYYPEPGSVAESGVSILEEGLRTSRFHRCDQIRLVVQTSNAPGDEQYQ
jgi:hypothetical protein